jgi:hypothetical protein
MFQPQAPFDSPNASPDPGPGIGAGFGIGVLVYIASWFALLVMDMYVFSDQTVRTYTFANLIAHIVLNGGLILRSLARGQKNFAQGLIMCAAMSVLLDGACWHLAR